MTAAALVVGAFALVLVAVLVAGVLRTQARLAQRLEMLEAGPSGDPVYGVAGVTPEGDAIELDLADPAGPRLLVFLTTTCVTCAEIWPTLGRDARVVAITKDERDERPARLRELAGTDVTVVMSAEAWSAFGVRVAPYAVLTDPATGTAIARGPVVTWRDVARIGRAG
ncbi:MAG TPA: hypothetical protein VFF40_03920 [Acidimicrobiia bacterium]|nr:hypothetical protein [Acidimicrobiia bacterium]